jgi:hypothetical protein
MVRQKTGWNKKERKKERKNNETANVLGMVDDGRQILANIN